MGKLFVIGIGPGDSDFLSDAAKKALHSCSLIIGYTVYVKLIHHLFPEKQIIESGMRKEIERCQLALDKTQNGETVALICSGDAGIYGMAGLVYELSSSFPSVHIEVIPGITAATAGAALLGAPLINDFAVISLSNLLTPQNEINKRLSAAAQGNLCICLYNPASSTRPHVLRDACRIILTYRSPETVCGITRNIGRHNQSVRFTSLAELEREQLDMFCTVFIGNEATVLLQSADGDKMVTRRGYKTPLAYSKSQTSNKLGVLIFAGTSDGGNLIQELKKIYTVFISVATDYGYRLFSSRYPDCTLLTGKLNQTQIYACLKDNHIAFVIDAAHPYAQTVHTEIQCGAKMASVPYYRLIRNSKYRPEIADKQSVYMVSSIKDACTYASKQNGNIFILSGSKAISEYTTITGFPKRVFIRILPDQEIIQKCTDAGFLSQNIIAMHGPFDTALNEAFFRHYNIKVLITKDSGDAGGFTEKMQAAANCGILSIIVTRPDENNQGYTETALIEYLRTEGKI